MLAGELNLPGHVMAPKGITTCSQHNIDAAEQNASVEPIPAVIAVSQQDCKQLSMQHSKSSPPAVDGKQ